MAKYIGSVPAALLISNSVTGLRVRRSELTDISSIFSAHLYPYDEAEHGHLAPPLDPVSDADSDPEEDRKPKAERGTPSSSSGAVGVQRANGRTKSAAEVDSEDDLSF